MAKGTSTKKCDVSEMFEFMISEASDLKLYRMIKEYEAEQDDNTKVIRDIFLKIAYRHKEQRVTAMKKRMLDYVELTPEGEAAIGMRDLAVDTRNAFFDLAAELCFSLGSPEEAQKAIDGIQKDGEKQNRLRDTLAGSEAIV